MLKMRSTLTEMKTAFDRLISRLDMVKEKIGELEEPSQKLPKLKLKITQELQDNYKGHNTHIKGIPEGNKQKEKYLNNDNFLKCMTDTKPDPGNAGEH